MRLMPMVESHCRSAENQSFADRSFLIADENEMVLIGYLAFLDPPKETTAAAIRALQEHGVAVKILTGTMKRLQNVFAVM